MRSPSSAVRIAAVFLVTMGCAGAPAATDSIIRGIVTDPTGKPIRGATITATSAGFRISRFSRNDGRYRITAKPGTYEISAEAFGFLPAKQTKNTARSDEINFKLTPGIDAAHLNGAEIDRLLPNTPEAQLLRDSCVVCHDLDAVVKKRGSASAQWQAYLNTMNDGSRMFQVKYTPAQLASLGASLEKYFGPDSPYFGPDSHPIQPDQIQHAKIPDAALNATIREYKVPTDDAWIYSVKVDPVREIAWFSEYDYISNKVGRFDIATETFHEYPIPIPKARPHTPIVGKDGRAWMPLDGSLNAPVKLISVDPATGEMKLHEWPGKPENLHTSAVDLAGNLWFSSMSAREDYLSFDVMAERFRAYKRPAAASAPDRSSPETSGALYDVDVDSTGKIWFAEVNVGKIARFDPKTGETIEFQPPSTPKVNALTIDVNDDVWFADVPGHRLGKLNPKTGAFEMYRPPTASARPIGLVSDKKRGVIWFSDLSGNRITRFAPKTGDFTEFPLPSPGSYPRFIGLDGLGRPWFGEWWNGKIGVVDPGDIPRVAARKKN